MFTARKIVRWISGVAIILICIWAFYNPNLAQRGFDKLAPVVITKLACVSPWLILFFAKDIINGVIDAVVTLVAMYVVYMACVSAGVIPDVLPGILAGMLEAIKGFRPAIS